MGSVPSCKQQKVGQAEQSMARSCCRGAYSPLPGVSVLLLTLELMLQLTDHLLSVQHSLSGHSQVICHRGQSVSTRRAMLEPHSPQASLQSQASLVA